MKCIRENLFSGGKREVFVLFVLVPKNAVGFTVSFVKILTLKLRFQIETHSHMKHCVMTLGWFDLIQIYSFKL